MVCKERAISYQMLLVMLPLLAFALVISRRMRCLMMTSLGGRLKVYVSVNTVQANQMALDMYCS
jgi:hypothetical protein